MLTRIFEQPAANMAQMVSTFQAGPSHTLDAVHH